VGIERNRISTPSLKRSPKKVLEVGCLGFIVWPGEAPGCEEKPEDELQEESCNRSYAPTEEGG